MSEVLDVTTVLETAIQIETNGEAFYRQHMTGDLNPEVKALFAALAAQEAQHKQVFTRLLSTLNKGGPVEEPSGDFKEYLQSYTDALIFKGGDTILDSTQDGVLAFALRIEMKSIVYYLGMKRLMPPAQKTAIDRIIDEEYDHHVRLSTMRDRLKR